jgi:hypothetical protein
MGGSEVTNNNNEEESKTKPKIKGGLMSPKGSYNLNGQSSVRSTYKPIYVSSVNSSNPMTTKISITNRLNNSQTPKNK